MVFRRPLNFPGRVFHDGAARTLLARGGSALVALLFIFGCQAEVVATKDVLKPLTFIRKVGVEGKDGRAVASIVGDTPFQYRVSVDSDLNAYVVRIPDAVYDPALEKNMEFSSGPVSRVEVLERKALIQTVVVRFYARGRVPFPASGSGLEHVREGPRLSISWKLPEEGNGASPAAELKRTETRGRVKNVALAEDRLSPRPPAPRPSDSPARLPALSQLKPKKEGDYRVGPKDVLSIKVYREQELSGEFVVTGDGTINYPLLGRIRVGGFPVSQIERRIESLLSKDYLVNPSVTVTVSEYRSQEVQLLGAVNKPGTYALRGSTTLLEIISQGGGVDSEGGASVIVLRPRRDKEQEDQFFRVNLNELLRGADLSDNILLAGSDTVFVPRADSIFVFGQVKNPGPYKIKDRQITLTEAISMAGGLTRIAAANRTRVVRVEGGAERVLNVPLDRILEGDKSKDILLVAEDVVFVPESFF